MPFPRGNWSKNIKSREVLPNQDCQKEPLKIKLVLL